METVIGILLIVMGIFLIISVLMQSSKNHRLSGSIAGGAETFFGKEKGKSMDALFNKLTTIVTIIFVVLVLVLYVMQPSQAEIEAELLAQLQEQGIVDENGNLIETPDVSVEGETDAEGETPVEDGAPVENETPAEGEAPADETPAGEEAQTENSEETAE